MASAAVASHIAPTIGPLPILSQEPKPHFHNGQSSKPRPMSSSKATVARGRRERPCDACRKRKSRCVVAEGQKNCTTCSAQGQSCTYVEDPQPRKRRLDSHAREADLPKRRTTVSSDNVSISSDVRSESPTSASAVLDQHRQKARQYSTHIGPTTELEPILLDLTLVGGASSPEEVYHKPDDRTTFFVDKGFTRTNSTAFEDVEKLVGPHGPALVQLYQTNIHPNFPVIEDELFSDYHAGRTSNIDPALLAAIYMLALPWLSESQSAPSPDASNLEDITFAIFGDSIPKPTISTIQTGLLLMQIHNVDSKPLNTQLVFAAYELGLHLDCSSWDMPSSERSLRKRLAWALFMQDKWSALIHGRPSSITPNNWAVRQLLDSDFDPSTPTAKKLSNTAMAELERGKLIFMHMVSLTEILATILETFYTLRAMQDVEDAGPNGRRLILDRAKPVQIKLKEWFAGLPATLKIEASMTAKPSSTGHLHLSYFATEITLHRCIIRTSSSTPALTHILRSAAKTRLISAMDFVNRLRPAHLLAFWPFPSRVNFALIGTFGALLAATAPCSEEVAFYKKRLAEYRWTLGVSSQSAGWLAWAVNSLEKSVEMLEKLPGRPEAGEGGLIDGLAVELGERGEGREASSRGLKLGLAGEGLAHASGLASPSTSASSGEESYKALVGLGKGR